MMDPLDKTLSHWRKTPFAYGSEDCVLSVLRYAAELGAKDVVPLYAGQYDDQEGALWTMEDAGGFAALIESCGAVPVNGPPERGDIVGVVMGDGDCIGGLCTGGMIAMRLERGVVEIAARLLKLKGVWRVVL